ncbi:hypothetical protein [Bacillus xiapuensis]|uniref:hypothetical protein n=1 Tax=Bacillus xiapuensis TaxID=2014075 RepID=UPI000C23292E|nr:hypothetical protein [Bacillus xiapuensis]
MAENILQNKEVADAKVEQEAGIAEAVRMLQEEASPEKEKALVDKYMDELTKKYPKQNVNAIVSKQE